MSKTENFSKIVSKTLHFFQFQYSLLFPGLNPKESKRMKTDFMEVDQNHKEITQSAYSSPAEHLVRKKPVAPPKQVTPTRFWKWFIEVDEFPRRIKKMSDLFDFRMILSQTHQS